MTTPKKITEAQRSNVTRIYHAQEMSEIFMETFDRVGGIDRLVAWANQNRNYPEFLKLLVKFAPRDPVTPHDGAIFEYRSMVPQSSLNRHIAHENPNLKDITPALEVDRDA